jgi:type I restriction enzyme S subunit
MEVGSNYPAVNEHDVRRIQFYAPEAPDRHRIGVVLDTLDASIGKTEAVIAKLREVRTGLLHDLLTRGIDQNGQLRAPLDNPEQFVNSSIGPMPKGWAIRPLRECLLGNPQNGIYKPARQIGRGILLVGQTSIDEDRRINISLARRAEVTAPEIERFGLAEGDILISRVFATLAGVGMPALVPPLPEPAVYESNMMRLQVDRRVILPCLLFEALRGCRVRARIIAAAHLSNQASINQVGLNPIPMCLPPVEEQCAIVNQIVRHDELLDAATYELRKLTQLRSGLTADLLSGRIQVPEGIGTEAT